MASQALFDKIPPFPDNLRCADIPAVSLAKLSARDVAEGRRVFEACHAIGFFLLDLRDDALGREMTKEIDHMFQASRETFDLPYEEKMKYHHDVSKSLIGYKSRGEITTAQGKPDRHQTYTIGYDDIVGNEPARSNISTLEKERPVLHSLFQKSHTILSHVLHALERELKLPSGSLQELHATGKTSGTSMRTMHYGASLADADLRQSLPPHTDWGSVSLLANLAGGLQVLRAGHDAADERGWEWVRPRPGFLVVNLGDAMVEWTAGLLRSNMHRVNHSPGAQRYVDRQSIVFVFRPNADAHMRRLAGGLVPTLEDDVRQGIAALAGSGWDAAELTAFEWEKRKAMDLMAGKQIPHSRGGRELVGY